MTPRSVLAILLILVQIPALAARVAPNEAEQFLMQQMTFVHRLLVDYCVSSAPESGPSLEHHLDDLNIRMAAASAPVLDRLRAEGAFEVTILPEDHAKLAEAKRLMRADMDNVEPHAYCRRLVLKLRTLDAQAMVNAAELTHLKYIAAAKARARATK